MVARRRLVAHPTSGFRLDTPPTMTTCTATDSPLDRPTGNAFGDRNLVRQVRPRDAERARDRVRNPRTDTRPSPAGSTNATRAGIRAAPRRPVAVRDPVAPVRSFEKANRGEARTDADYPAAPCSARNLRKATSDVKPQRRRHPVCTRIRMHFARSATLRPELRAPLSHRLRDSGCPSSAKHSPPPPIRRPSSPGPIGHGRPCHPQRGRPRRPLRPARDDAPRRSS